MPRNPLRPTRNRTARLISVVAGALLVGAAVAGCAPEPAPAPTSDPTPAVTATPTPAPTGPVLMPEGSAADNLPLFTEVMREVAAGAHKVEGRAYIDALVAAGFAKSAMEVTHDRTTVDDPADSIQFSVLWAGECLIGQVGPSTPTPTAVIMPELPGGGCLIGATRDIDW